MSVLLLLVILISTSITFKSSTSIKSVKKSLLELRTTLFKSQYSGAKGCFAFCIALVLELALGQRTANQIALRSNKRNAHGLLSVNRRKQMSSSNLSGIAWITIVTSVLAAPSVMGALADGNSAGQSEKPQMQHRYHGHHQSIRSAQISSTATSISSPSFSLTHQLSSLDVVSQYALPNGSYFTHLTYDRKNSVLYAGASNRIIQLNRNLSILSQAITGPKADNPQSCHGGCPDDVETSETTNHNKILTINQAGGTLIACGSVRQGSCDIYKLGEFPQSPEYIELPLAANDEFATTYAFIGPSRYNSWKKEDVLYVGTTFTNIGEYRHDVPAISSRRLDDLNFAEYSIQQSILNIDVKYRDHFLVDYVFGFNTSEYAYFAVVQKKSHLAEEAGYVTRLARICVNDPNYDSYTEITIQCKRRNDEDGTETNYNILRDAKLTPAGQRLAQQLGIKRDDYILLAVFSPAKEITNEPQAKSAMCIYSLKEIEETFTENIHMCFNGTIKDRNLGYISGTINDGKCPVVGVSMPDLSRLVSISRISL